MKNKNPIYTFYIIGFLLFSILRTYPQGNLINNNWTIEPVSGGAVTTNSSLMELPPDGGVAIYYLGLGGRIYQNVSTITGNYYSLDFQAIQFEGTNYASVGLNNALFAKLNFTNMAGFLPYGGTANTNWENFSYTFQAVSDVTLIQFTYYPQRFMNASGSGSVGDISLMQVPEPSNMVLLGGGLAVGIIYYRRRWLNPPKAP